MAEHDETVAVVEYCALLGLPVYHVPNEGRRGPGEAARLKAEGLSAGVPDLCIPVARGPYHSLYIEMKAEGGKPTEEQVRWIHLLRGQGMCAYVCVGADNAIALIDLYMGL